MAQQQFFTQKTQVPLPAGDTLAFEKGRGYYSKPPKVGPGASATGGMFGLNSSDKALAKYLSSLFGNPETPQQAQSDVQAQVNPILAQLSADAEARMKAGSDAISGLTDTYSKRLAAIEPQVHAHDQEAQGNEQAAGGALRDYLASEGNTLAGGVEAAGAGAPAGSAMANAAAAAGGGVAGLGAGTAGESAARGYTGLSDLISSGQHAEDYASTLPALAGLAGEQGLGTLASNVEGDFQGKSNAVTAQIPGMVEQIMQDARTTKQQKAQLLAQFLSGALDRNTSAGVALAGLGKDMSVAQLQAAAAKYGVDTRAASASASLAERTRHDAALESQAQASWGVSVQRLRDAEAKAQAAAKNGGLTADGLARIQREAATDLQTLFNNVPARYETGPGGQRILVDGTGPGTAHTYQEAINQLMLKYPSLGPQRIIQMVNHTYAPGVGGRPEKQTPLGPGFWKNVASGVTSGVSAASGG